MKWSVWVVVLGLAGACSGSPTEPSGRSPIPLAPSGGPVTMLAGGDIGWCPDLAGAEATARILDQHPGTVLALGDLAYFSGTAEQFRTCYGPTWGRHRSRTRPVPGNHEYETAGAAPYFEYFGESAGPYGDGYYAFTASTWHVIALNSNVPMGRGSPQHAWLQRELQRPSRCTLAYWHHPRFSSGPNGDTAATQPLWDALYEAGVDVVLAGHDHIYERYLPMSPDGQLDRARGIRQFIAGGGGAQLYPLVSVKANSAARHAGYGVLRLVLGDGRYDWEFLPTEPGFSDAGFDVCH